MSRIKNDAFVGISRSIHNNPSAAKPAVGTARSQGAYGGALTSSPCLSARTLSRGDAVTNSAPQASSHPTVPTFQQRTDSRQSGTFQAGTDSRQGGPSYASSGGLQRGSERKSATTGSATGTISRTNSGGLSSNAARAAGRALHSTSSGQTLGSNSRTQQSTPNTPASMSRRISPTQRTAASQSQSSLAQRQPMQTSQPVHSSGMQASRGQHVSSGYGGQQGGVASPSTMSRSIRSPDPVSTPIQGNRRAGTGVATPTMTSSARVPAGRRLGPSSPHNSQRSLQSGANGTPSTGGALNRSVRSQPGVPRSGQSTTSPGTPTMDKDARRYADQLLDDKAIGVPNLLPEHEEVIRNWQGNSNSKPPGNAVVNFFRQAVAKERRGNSILTTPRMDVNMYWEKRRVQNEIRRVLETIQDNFGLDGDGQPQDLDAVFDRLANKAADRRRDDDELGEVLFFESLDRYKLWPPDLSVDERSEIFTTLMIPSNAAAVSYIAGGHLNPALTRSGFRDGFDRLPFNLPDYPVPRDLTGANQSAILASGSYAVAEAIVATMCTEHHSQHQIGIGRSKDIFLTGLLSIEEIQRALPSLLPISLVEDAVVYIIRTASPLFSPDDWQDLVFSVRTAEACGHNAEPEEPTDVLDSRLDTSHASHVNESIVSLGSPIMQSRSLPEQPVVQQLASIVGHGASRVDGASFLSSSSILQESMLAHTPDNGTPARHRMGRSEAAVAPMTEPVFTRDMRAEHPVTFATASSSGCGASGSTALTPGPVFRRAASAAAPVASAPKARVINWNTAAPTEADQSTGNVTASPACSFRDIGHQADQGAGSRMTWGTSGFKQHCAAAAAQRKARVSSSAISSSGQESKQEPPAGMPDPVAWLNLELHSECGGPYLAKAFLRCAQLYSRGKQRAAMMSLS